MSVLNTTVTTPRSTTPVVTIGKKFSFDWGTTSKKNLKGESVVALIRESGSPTVDVIITNKSGTGKDMLQEVARGAKARITKVGNSIVLNMGQPKMAKADAEPGKRGRAPMEVSELIFQLRDPKAKRAKPTKELVSRASGLTKSFYKGSPEGQVTSVFEFIRKYGVMSEIGRRKLAEFNEHFEKSPSLQALIEEDTPVARRLKAIRACATEE